MRVRKEAEPIEMTCKCGKNYIAYSMKSTMCPDCREIWHKEYMRQYRELEKQKRREKKKVKIFKPMRRVAPKKSMREIMRELNKYNREHDKHISYGQYVSMMDGGKK